MRHILYIKLSLLDVFILNLALVCAGGQLGGRAGRHVVLPEHHPYTHPRIESDKKTTILAPNETS